MSCRNRVFTVLSTFLLLSTLWGCAEGDDKNGGLGVIPKSGETYQSGDRIYLPEGGLSFTIPTGFKGEGNEKTLTIYMEETKGAVIGSTGEGDSGELEAELKGTIQLDDLTLKPSGSLDKSSDTATMEYTIDEIAGGRGVITALYGGYGHIGLAMGLGTSDSYDSFEAATADVVDSMDLTDPSAAPVSESGGGSSSGSSPKMDWSAEVSGYKFTYYETGDGYTIKNKYTFCSDGSAGYYSSSFYGDLGSSIEDYYGRWELVNEGADYADFNLFWENGESWGEDITYADGDFLIDGSKWFREDAGC